MNTDPGMVDFGSVVVNSTVEFTLSVRNSTTNHIKLKMKVYFNYILPYSIR